MLSGFRPIEFVQIVARICETKSQEPFSKNWYPNIEPSMENFFIKEPSKLVKYVMHAKHGKNETKDLL